MSRYVVVDIVGACVQRGVATSRVAHGAAPTTSRGGSRRGIASRDGAIDGCIGVLTFSMKLSAVVGGW